MENVQDDFLAACGAAIVFTAFACLFAIFIGDTPYQKGFYAGLWSWVGFFAGRQDLRRHG